MPDKYLDKFIESVTLVPGDPTFSILKSHLLIEDLLRSFVEKNVAHPSVLKDARLTFAQVMHLSRAMVTAVGFDHWMWKAIGDLNKLRNLLAHNLEAADFEKKVSEYVDYIRKNMPNPFPEPLHGVDREALIESGYTPKYFAFDVATIGLYGVVLTSLGFATLKDF